MSDQPITLTLSRADAERMAEMLETRRVIVYADGSNRRFIVTDEIQRAFKHALNAAPAEGPERAAPGETARCGRCGASFVPHPNPARFDHDFCEACLPAAVAFWGMMQTRTGQRAAIVGGGEG